METLKFTRKVTKLLEGNVSKLHDFRIISDKNRVEIKLSYKSQEKIEENWIYDDYAVADMVLESIRSALNKLQMETLYRKIEVSERKPKRGGTYFSNEGEVFYSASHKEFQHNYDPHTMYPEWWLEPIPDHTAQLQADKEELLEALENVKEMLYVPQTPSSQHTVIYDEIESLIQKMKK